MGTEIFSYDRILLKEYCAFLIAICWLDRARKKINIVTVCLSHSDIIGNLKLHNYRNNLQVF